jgi:hypothetical protein
MNLKELLVAALKQHLGVTDLLGAVGEAIADYSDGLPTPLGREFNNGVAVNVLCLRNDIRRRSMEYANAHEWLTRIANRCAAAHDGQAWKFLMDRRNSMKI